MILTSAFNLKTLAEEYQDKLRCGDCMPAITSRKEQHHQRVNAVKQSLNQSLMRDI